LGEKIYTVTGYKNTVINLTGQPGGLYFYRVVSNNGGLEGEGKLVIQ
jgi:hypothetical protein